MTDTQFLQLIASGYLFVSFIFTSSVYILCHGIVDYLKRKGDTNEEDNFNN